jgi:NAD(P)-dependent dehydrogenase (short-subunit alcohol dehydrogenase family)
MDLGLAGRVAVVTGGTKGIGLAVTRALLDEGARVVTASRKPSSALTELTGENLVHVAVDLRDPEAPGQVVATAASEFGGLDILVNNVGGPPPGAVMPRTSFLAVTDEDWLAMLEFNLLTAVRACRAAVPLLLDRRGGAIVNVSTVHARHPMTMNLDYSAAKAALNTLTKSLSEEFAPRGIRVNTVSPGPVLTELWTTPGGAADILAAHLGVDRDTVITTVVPERMNLSTGRMATPEEVADAVVLLAAPRSANTTGAEVTIDSGFHKAL